MPKYFLWVKLAESTIFPPLDDGGTHNNNNKGGGGANKLTEISISAKISGGGGGGPGGGGAGGDGNQKHGLAKVTLAEKIKTIFKSLERFKKGTEWKETH